MISYIIPTKDRHEELMRTLGEINRLGRQVGMGGAEVVVVDNASSKPVQLPDQLPCGTGVKTVRLDENIGAAARNVAAQHADERCDWFVMLDDDSAPMDSAFEVAIRRASPDVAAISADVYLGQSEDTVTRREDGGLPEVFVGCGVAVRRDAFIDAGGYDESFGFYAEEYDLSAKIMLSGKRVEFSPIFRVLHRKARTGRDMNLIVQRLVRNNAWTIQRYAPLGVLEEELGRSKERCRFIAQKENAMPGFDAGLAQLEETIAGQRRTPMDDAMWDRFTGLAAARKALGARLPRGTETVELIAEGKNAHVVRRALHDMGVTPVRSGGQLRVIGTMSPGPMIDALECADGGSPVVAPWLCAKKLSIFGDVATGFAA